MASRKLGIKQQRFVDEYLVDMNATQAAIRAGYAKRGAQVHGSRLLSNPMIKAAIKERTKPLAEKLALTADRVLAEYMKLAFSNFEDCTSIDEDSGEAYLDYEKMTRDQRAAISEMTTESIGRGVTRMKIKLYDKKGALQDLGKYLRLFVEQVEVKTDVSFAERLERAIKRSEES